MNKFEMAIDRIKKNVEIQDSWTEEDLEHYKTIIEALEIASDLCKVNIRPTEKGSDTLDNIQKCEKTVYHYIYENNPKAEELKSKIAEIKSHRTPPDKEDDVYYLREPWRKFGCVGGFVMGWCWFKDEYIYAKATENDVEMAYNEINGGD